MSDAIASFGTYLKIGDGESTEGFTTIAELLDIDVPGMAMTTAEVTNQTSTAAFREFIGTLLDGGEVTFDVNYVPTAGTHDATTGVIADMVNKTLRNFELVFPGAVATWSFAALIISFKPNMPVDGPLKASITLKISGQPTLV